MSIDGEYGASPEDSWDRWEPFLVHYSHRVCQDLSRIEDVAQEGRVALWRALKDGVPYPVEVAKSRMKQVSWYSRTTPPTGSLHEGKRYEPQTQSIEAESGRDGSSDDIVARLFGLVDHLEDVEIAYHQGEIAEAISTLTPKQRAYVYARFWCGMDTVAGSRNDGLRLAKEMNPQVNDRSGVLWTGNKTTRGAKDRLVEALDHLRGLVSVDG